MSRAAARAMRAATAGTLAALLAGAILAASASASAAESPKPAPKDGWPETPAGAAARQWVAAFAKGEEAMRACLTEILAPASLAERGIEERMTTYRENREKFGAWTLAAVEKSAPDELEATLLASDLSKHRFVFKVEPSPPHRLLSVGRLQTVNVPGHGGFHH